jgi:hypothetical protein
MLLNCDGILRKGHRYDRRKLPMPVGLMSGGVLQRSSLPSDYGMFVHAAFCQSDVFQFSLTVSTDRLKSAMPVVERGVASRYEDRSLSRPPSSG